MGMASGQHQPGGERVDSTAENMNQGQGMADRIASVQAAGITGLIAGRMEPAPLVPRPDGLNPSHRGLWGAVSQARPQGAEIRQGVGRTRFASAVHC
jgi:hypothetical protein